MLKALLELASMYGSYIGVFTISLVSNSVPFIGVPYLLIIASYVAREAVRFGLPVELALILASALGSTAGKLIVYFIAAGFRFKLSENTKNNLKYFVSYSRRLALPLIILFAATPAPDDLLYVPLGVARYPLTYYFLGIFIGKFIMVWLATTYFRVLFKYLGDEVVTNPVVGVGVAALTMYLTITIMRMDWRKIAEVYSEKGIVQSIKTIIEEFLSASLRLLRKLLTCFPIGSNLKHA
ncbi:MAG: VTT domain-containing protein [Sulfolobales archaeon]